MRWCHTDLGANAYSWQRLLAEGRRFGAPGPGAEGVGAEHYDGVLASAIVNAGGRRCSTWCSPIAGSKQNQ